MDNKSIPDRANPIHQHIDIRQIRNVLVNAGQLVNGFKPDAVEGNYWSEWDQSVLDSIVNLLKTLPDAYPQSVKVKAEQWARWYANEGSYQEWLSLPTSPFGQEGKFAACFRHAKSGFLAGSHSIGEEIVKQLEEANPYGLQSEDDNRATKYASWLKCIETLRSLINQQSLNNKEGI